jgi:hypothetical protein
VSSVSEPSTEEPVRIYIQASLDETIRAIEGVLQVRREQISGAAYPLLHEIIEPGNGLPAEDGTEMLFCDNAVSWPTELATSDGKVAVRTHFYSQRLLVSGGVGGIGRGGQGRLCAWKIFAALSAQERNVALTYDDIFVHGIAYAPIDFLHVR